MGVSLEIIKQPDISIEAECLNPSILSLDLADILRLKAWQGKVQVEIGEFFSAKKTDDDALHIEGDLRRVKRLGQNTTGGKLVVHGSCGMHFCEGISGGQVEVHGDIAEWSLNLMRGGEVKIYGSAGAFMAASLPGDAHGMKGGVIWVQNDVGPRAFERMRRGLAVVGGAIGEFAATEMIAGTVVSMGYLGARAGASMKRGTILAMGESEPLMCGFEKSCSYYPAFTGLLGRELSRMGFITDIKPFEGRFERWCGDAVSLGKGEVLIHE